MRRLPMPRVSAAAALIWAAVAFAGQAQETGAGADAGDPAAPPAAAAAEPTLPPPILTLNQDRLFAESAFGRAVQARAEAESAALTAENRRLEEALAAEERALTDRRASLPTDEFTRLANEFDAKVEDIRAAQDAKSRAITRRIEEDRQRFFEAATPVLGDLLAETGAAAILADSAIVMSLTSLDITPAAIARMDTVLPAPQDAGAPAPAPAPEGPAPAPSSP